MHRRNNEIVMHATMKKPGSHPAFLLRSEQVSAGLGGATGFRCGMVIQISRWRRKEEDRS
jgi:hypothetical protein